MVKDLGNRVSVDSQITSGANTAQVTTDGRLQVALPASTSTLGSVQVTDGTRTAALSETNAQLTTNIKAVFRDAFRTLDATTWTVTKAASDVVAIDGNAFASYLKITKGLVANTHTTLLSTQSFDVPCRFTTGASLSRRMNGQDFAVELVQCDADGNVLEETFTPVALSALPVCSTAGTLIFTTASAHKLNVGDRIALYGQTTSALNLGPVYVTSVPSSTTFTVAAAGTTAQTYGSAISGFVAKADPLRGATHAMSALMYGNSHNSGDAVVRAGHTMPLTTTWNPQFNWTSASSSSAAYTYTASPTNYTELMVSQDHVTWSIAYTDSTAPMNSTTKRDQIVLDPSKKCKIRVRASNLPNFPGVPLRITYAYKATATTVATLTVPNHGLAVSDTIYAWGVRDQTVFGQSGSQLVASVIDANTITVANMGSATAGSSHGGVIFKQNGGVGTSSSVTIQSLTPPGYWSIQSISATAAGRMSTVWQGATSWTIGESVYVLGLAGPGLVTYPQFEGLYRIANYNTTTFTVELDPLQGQDMTALGALGTVLTGGSAVGATDMRIHYASVLEYTRHVMELYASRTLGDTLNAVPISLMGQNGTVGANGALIGAVNLQLMQNLAALGTLYTTNLNAGASTIVPAVDFQTTTIKYTKYFSMLVTDRQCDFVLETSGDNVTYDAASPRVTSTRQAGDTLVITALGRTSNVVTATTSVAPMFQGGAVGGDPGVDVLQRKLQRQFSSRERCNRNDLHVLPDWGHRKRGRYCCNRHGLCQSVCPALCPGYPEVRARASV